MRVALLLLVGCVDGPGQSPWPYAPDDARFATEVQPVLAARCANPACHGSVERPFEVYAVRRHRLDPDDVWLDAPLTSEERWWNWIRSCGLVLDATDPDTCALLTKPLAEAAGGVGHEGGAQFGDRGNREFRVLEDWVRDTMEDP